MDYWKGVYKLSRAFLVSLEMFNESIHRHLET